MNEHLTTSENGVALITSFEGAPRLKARMCEGGAWELSWGVTFHPDGTPVQEGEEITYEYAVIMFRHALRVFEEAVHRQVTVELTQNQFDALVSFAYNIGEANLATSTVLREVNQRMFDDAAEAFGMWLYATKNGYRRALRGLLRRRYAEACVFLGYDWEEACADGAIALSVQKPARLPGRDTVLYKTPFANVLAVAREYPLTAMPDEILEDPEEYSRVAGEGEVPIALPPSSVPADPPPAMTPSVAGGLPYAATPPINGAGTKPPSVYTVPPDKVPYKVDPNAGAKPLEDSDRVKGYVNQEFGKAIIRVGALGGFGSGAAGMLQALENDPVLMGVYLTLFTSLGALAIGKGIELYGDWKRKRGEEAASQLLF